MREKTRTPFVLREQKESGASFRKFAQAENLRPRRLPASPPNGFLVRSGLDVEDSFSFGLVLGGQHVQHVLVDLEGRRLGGLVGNKLDLDVRNGGRHWLYA